MDQDLWMKALVHHGPLLLHTILSDIPDTESEVPTENLKICKFIKKKINLLFQTVTDHDDDEKPESAIPTLPIELFQNVEELDRRNMFFRSLDHGSILLLRVINDTLPDYYTLLVLAKHGSCMKLDDLSLLMYLPKLPPEMNLAGGELRADDYIRAAVCSCSIDERKIYVTLDSNIFDDENDQVPLGRITREDLPPYIGKLDVGSTYIEYLRHIPAFHDPEWDKELETVLGLENTRMYSFLEEWDGKTYPEDECASYLKRKQELFFSNLHYQKALAHCEKKNSTEAFLYLNKALSICSENVDALITRGNLYFENDNLSKAVLDLDTAVRIEPSNATARQQMSKFLVALAKVHLADKDHDRAQECLTIALNHNQENGEAAKLLQILSEKSTASSQASSKLGLIKSLGSKVIYSTSSSCSTPNSKLGEPRDLLDSPSTLLDPSTRLKSPHKRKRRHRHHHHSHQHKKHSFKL